MQGTSGKVGSAALSMGSVWLPEGQDDDLGELGPSHERVGMEEAVAP